MSYLDDLHERRLERQASRPADDHDRYYDGATYLGSASDEFPPWTDTLDDHESELA